MLLYLKLKVDTSLTASTVWTRINEENQQLHYLEPWNFTSEQLPEVNFGTVRRTRPLCVAATSDNGSTWNSSQISLEDLTVRGGANQRYMIGAILLKLHVCQAMMFGSSNMNNNNAVTSDKYGETDQQSFLPRV